VLPCVEISSGYARVFRRSMNPIVVFGDAKDVARKEYILMSNRNTNKHLVINTGPMENQRRFIN
jgi:hypothetical protein